MNAHYFKLRKNIILYYIILITFLFNKCSSEIIKCEKNAPILFPKQCNLTYCSKEQFTSKECIIANQIIETQWLNNIIVFGDLTYRYLATTSFPEGDIIFEVTCYPKSAKRMFYGLKKNGRPFFKNKITDEETPFYSKNIDGTKGHYEIEAYVIKASGEQNNGQEYFFSFSKSESFAEIYDFKNDIAYYKSTPDFTGVNPIFSYRQAILLLYNTSYDFYYLIGFIVGSPSESKNLYFQKHIFRSIDNFEKTTTYDNSKIKKIENAYGKDLSCFKTSSENIICFYQTKEKEEKEKQNVIYFNLHKFDKNFSGDKILKIKTNLEIEKLFCKCIHLKDEIGIFSSYYNYSDLEPYPFFLFKEFKNDNFQDYLPSLYNESKIIIRKNYFSNILLLNDLIKINENKIVFISTSNNTEILYIIIFNIFGEKQIMIRYYSIEIYALYHYKILRDLRINNFNNLIAFASSYCPKQKCDSDEDEHYSALMIFSYPNSTDMTIYLEDYLFNNNLDDNHNFEIDLKEQLYFENNIFGYILSNIYIQEIEGPNPESKVYSSKDESIEIKENYKMEKDEKLILKFVVGPDYFLPIIDKIIKYYFIATEPDYNIYELYTDEIGGENDKNNFKKEEYNGRLSYYYFKSKTEYYFKCEDINCNLCLQTNLNDCLSCKYKFTLSEGNKKICHEKDTDLIIETTEILIESTTEKLTESITEKITDLKTEKNTEFEEIKEVKTEEIKEVKTEEIKEIKTEEIKNVENICSIDNILNNKCDEGIVAEEQMGQLYIQIKEEYVYNYNGNNTIIQTQNVIFQISSLEVQKYSNNPNVSSIDLGECEEILKTKYGIEEDLIVFKTDIKSLDLSKTYVQYEIYNPRDLTRLNLTICKDAKISLITPVKLSNSTSLLYDNLKEYGYNLFNESDAFYTDICSVYTSQNGTDMILEDRKKEIFSNNGNITLCQNGCELDSYNSTSQKAKCKCLPQIEETQPVLSSSYNKFSIIKLTASLTLKNSNFIVMRCYKLAIDLKNIWGNLGRLFMTIIAILSFIMLILFCFLDNKHIDNFIKSLINSKINDEIRLKQLKHKNENELINNKNIKNKRRNNIKSKTVLLNKNRAIKKKNLSSKFSSQSIFKIKEVPPKKNSGTLNVEAKLNKSKKNNNQLDSKIKLNDEIFRKNSKKKTIKNNNPSINLVKINRLNIKNIIEKKFKRDKDFNKIKNISEKDKKMKRKGSNISNCSKDAFIMNNLKESIIKDKFEYRNLNDQELNTLEYEIAILLDKRTYFQYYWSLLKKKQLILFAFIPTNDYNLASIKICLFLLSFSLYFTINGFFFSDKTMHKIHEDKGKFNIIYQMPQILYSTLVTSFISFILKELSLSEKKILEIKREKDIQKKKNYAKNIKNHLTIKFIIYFILNYIFLLFFWYFISCFCAVYKNTQIILIKDTLFSFSLSMLYPFGLNLLPGMLRIPAIRAEKKNKKCLYQIIALISYI